MADGSGFGMRTSVLVIDGDRVHVDRVRRHLAGSGVDVIAAESGDAGLQIALRHAPDLILLEVQLPGMDGLDVCRRLRSEERTRAIPVIILSALGSDLDRVVGLELGADDYVTKPFHPRELLARVRAVLRRVQPAPVGGPVRRVGELVVDVGRREVTYQGRRVPLTASEFRILDCLLARPGQVLSRGDILGAVHADDVAVTERTIDVHVGTIRRKLGPGGALIETLRGFGYRMRDERTLVPADGSGAAARRLASMLDGHPFGRPRRKLSSRGRAGFGR